MIGILRVKRCDLLNVDDLPIFRLINRRLDDLFELLVDRQTVVNC